MVNLKTVLIVKNEPKTFEKNICYITQFAPLRVSVTFMSDPCLRRSPQTRRIQDSYTKM